MSRQTLQGVSFWLAVAMLAGAADVAVAASYRPAPSESLLEQLKRQHDRRNWLRVTSDSLRWEVRAREITPHGLSGITTRSSGAPAPDPIPWSSIARIDRVHTHAVAGFFGGAIAGVALGSLALSISQNNASHLSTTAIVVSAGVGALAGTAAGSTVKTERLVYEPPVEGIVGLGDTTSTVSPEVSRALGKLHLERRLRIEGDFGTYEGYASRLGPQGIEGVRPDPSEGARPPLEHVGWEQITRVQQQGNAASKGAVVGGVLGGITLGLAGAWVGAWTETEGGHGGLLGGALAGGLLGAASGAALGAITGSVIPAWHKVYERR